MEYSYFDPNVLSTWAGPNHWKAKFGKKHASSIDCESDDGETNKKKKRKTIKRDVDQRVNLDEDLPFGKIFKVGNASTTLSKSAWEKYYEQQRTLDPDMECKPDMFSRLFLKPDFKVNFLKHAVGRSAVNIFLILDFEI